MKGTIKWFNEDKGYGFVESEDGKEFFVHHSNVSNGTILNENDIVTFETEDTDKGPAATNVAIAA